MGVGKREDGIPPQRDGNYPGEARQTGEVEERGRGTEKKKLTGKRKLNRN